MGCGGGGHSVGVPAVGGGGDGGNTRLGEFDAAGKGLHPPAEADRLVGLAAQRRLGLEERGQKLLPSGLQRINVRLQRSGSGGLEGQGALGLLEAGLEEVELRAEVLCCIYVYNNIFRRIDKS